MGLDFKTGEKSILKQNTRYNFSFRDMQSLIGPVRLLKPCASYIGKTLANPFFPTSISVLGGRHVLSELQWLRFK